jgi:hypothetical protein
MPLKITALINQIIYFETTPNNLHKALIAIHLKNNDPFGKTAGGNLR